VEGEGIGRTEGFAVVRLRRPAAAGTVVPVTIAGHDGRHLIAA
jgi:threonylcarbamoyladenosine tRNA methylthiotransferase MtaB